MHGAVGDDRVQLSRPGRRPTTGRPSGGDGGGRRRARTGPRRGRARRAGPGHCSSRRRARACRRDGPARPPSRASTIHECSTTRFRGCGRTLRSAADRMVRSPVGAGVVVTTRPGYPPHGQLDAGGRRCRRPAGRAVHHQVGADSSAPGRHDVGDPAARRGQRAAGAPGPGRAAARPPRGPHSSDAAGCRHRPSAPRAAATCARARSPRSGRTGPAAS